MSEVKKPSKFVSMPTLRYSLGAAAIYLVALVAAAYCYFSYTSMLAYADELQPHIRFQTNLYVLMLPLAFIVMDLFCLMQRGLAKIHLACVGSPLGVFVLAFLGILLVGYLVQQRIEYEIRRSGYVDCTSLAKKPLGSPVLTFVLSTPHCNLLTARSGESIGN